MIAEEWIHIPPQREQTRPEVSAKRHWLGRDRKPNAPVAETRSEEPGKRSPVWDSESTGPRRHASGSTAERFPSHSGMERMSWGALQGVHLGTGGA